MFLVLFCSNSALKSDLSKIQFVCDRRTDILSFRDSRTHLKRNKSDRRDSGYGKDANDGNVGGFDGKDGYDIDDERGVDGKCYGQWARRRCTNRVNRRGNSAPPSNIQDANSGSKYHIRLSFVENLLSLSIYFQGRASTYVFSLK